MAFQMAPKPHAGHQNRKYETDHFFEQLEDFVVDRLRHIADSPESRQELVRCTGIDDPALIQELADLGITPDGLIALRLLPLVLVAWAEERVDAEERQAILDEAYRLGIVEDSVPWILLDSWLRKPPTRLGIDAWKRYTSGVLHSMSTQMALRLIETTQRQMTLVAKASGGHFGFGKISKREQHVIDEVTQQLKSQLV